MRGLGWGGGQNDRHILQYITVARQLLLFNEALNVQFLAERVSVQLSCLKP